MADKRKVSVQIRFEILEYLFFAGKNQLRTHICRKATATSYDDFLKHLLYLKEKGFAMKKIALIPSGISSLRLAALPLFLYSYSVGNPLACIVIFGLAQVTDLLDGYVARKIKAASKAGAYFDAVTDFVFITGIFAAFTISGYYPVWIMLLIAASFGQFIVSSLRSKKLYDPLGKYIGSVLYIAIGLTLLWPTPIIFAVVEVGFPAFAIASFVTRMASFTSNYRRTLLIQKVTPQPHPGSNCITK